MTHDRCPNDTTFTHYYADKQNVSYESSDKHMIICADVCRSFLPPLCIVYQWSWFTGFQSRDEVATLIKGDLGRVPTGDRLTNCQ